MSDAMIHKHCVFCGVSSQAGGMVGAICPSKNNTLEPNTLGDRPHAYPISEWDSVPSPAEQETDTQEGRSTDKIRQAAEECASAMCSHLSNLAQIERCVKARADIIERAMRKLVPSEPNPYAIAMEKHLCEHDIADWLACAGHGDNFCAACTNEKEHSHNSQPALSPSEEELVCKIAASFYKVDKMTVETHYLPIISAYVAERVKEAERQAYLKVRQALEGVGDAPIPEGVCSNEDQEEGFSDGVCCTLNLAWKRIAELEGKR